MTMVMLVVMIAGAVPVPAAAQEAPLSAKVKEFIPNAGRQLEADSDYRQRVEWVNWT
ncbi:MAG: hypothetical protein V4564_14605 [Pseudomonadota bacterium]